MKRVYMRRHVLAYEVGRDDVVGVDDVHQRKWLAELCSDGREEQVIDAGDDPLGRQLPLAAGNVQLGARY